MAGGRVTVEGCRPGDLAPFLQFLRRTGCAVDEEADAFTVARAPGQRLQGGMTLCTGAWPGFATDTAPLAAAVLLGAAGPSRIHDALFQNRFACADGFAALGARVRAEGRDLYLSGGAELRGAAVTAPDLRGGAALVLAGLAAGGRTTVRDPGHIGRGYADLAGDLRRLGAVCELVTENRPQPVQIG